MHRSHQARTELLLASHNTRRYFRTSLSRLRALPSRSWHEQVFLYITSSVERIDYAMAGRGLPRVGSVRTARARTSLSRSPLCPCASASPAVLVPSPPVDLHRRSPLVESAGWFNIKEVSHG